MKPKFSKTLTLLLDEECAASLDKFIVECGGDKEKFGLVSQPIYREGFGWVLSVVYLKPDQFEAVNAGLHKAKNLEGSGFMTELGSIGAEMIEAERLRQVHTEGYDAEHDDSVVHNNGDLVRAAVAYACHGLVSINSMSNHTPNTPPANGPGSPPVIWPARWHSKHWKPKNRIRDLTRAGALIAAEIDCELRRQAKTGEPQQAETPSPIVDGRATRDIKKGELLEIPVEEYQKLRANIEQGGE